MTYNHLLLYRLAELMLEHEQHILPVDLLFDDDKIGDFVKSIQIDSPYQQMLLEGVLTESVKDEKLFVSFTVEGYFHYVLGEVLHDDERLNDPKTLTVLLESNRLTGLKEGIEQCILFDIRNHNYSRLFGMIDLGGIVLECCEFPLAFAFNFQSNSGKNIDDLNLLREQQIDFILTLLLADFTENDLLVLKSSLLKLYNLQQIKVMKSIYRKVFQYLKPKDKLSLELYIKCIQYLEKSDVSLALNIIDNSYKDIIADDNIEFYLKIVFQYNRLGDYSKSLHYLLHCESVVNEGISVDYKVESKLHSALATVYFNLEDYDKSLGFWDSSIRTLLNISDKTPMELGSRYNNKATTLMVLRRYDDAAKYFSLAFELQSKNYGLSHVSITNYYTNIAVLYSRKRDFQMARTMYEKSLELRKRIFGENHEQVANNYNGLGVTLGKMGDMKGAMGFLMKALEIQLVIFGEIHPEPALTYKNIGMGYYFNNFREDALNFLQIAHGIYTKLYTEDHRAVKEIERTLYNILRN